MTVRRLVASVFLLSAPLAACGDDGEQSSGPTPTAPAVTTSAPGTSSPGGSSPSTRAGTPGATGGGDIEFDDQDGDGTTVLVSRVSAPGAGFVVVSVHDGGSVLGWAAVDAGASDDVRVPLDPGLTRDTELDATLYADTDGDGVFDADSDRPVADPDRDRDGDHEGDDDGDDDRDRDRDGAHDVVDEDAHYRVR